MQEESGSTNSSDSKRKRINEIKLAAQLGHHPINNSVGAFLSLRHFEIVALSLASHLHIELTPNEKTEQVLGTMN